MTTAILMGWNRQQWLRAAEYWRNTQGALPAPMVAEAMRVIDHWDDNHVGPPALLSVLVDVDGNPVDRFDSDIISWAARTWHAFVREAGASLRPIPEYERRADELAKVECGTKLWP